jgi:YegS/Rv2252/BmrU family lipid kinase
MPKVAVVTHEAKVRGKTRKALQEALVDAGLDDASWHTVSKARKAEKAAREAVEAGAEVVLVGGGDGTVRAGAAGVVGTDAALAVLPAGTANLFAGALDLPTSAPDVIATITSGTRRILDTGLCNGQTFTVMAGTGFDAAMVGDADATKDRLGFLSYVNAGVRNARTLQPVGTCVELDGEQFFAGGATCVLVGNLGTLKGGLVAFPDASPTDGLLDVAVVTASGLTEWAAVLWSAVRRSQHRSGHAHVGQAREITVHLDGKQRLQLDGGAKGTTKKLQVSVCPHSLRLCAPAAAPS